MLRTNSKGSCVIKFTTTRDNEIEVRPLKQLIREILWAAVIPRCRTRAWYFRAANERSSLSLSLNLSLPLSFFDRRESFFCCVLWFFKKARKREKKIARGKKLFLKTKQQKKQEFLTTTTTTTTLKLLFRIFHHSSCEKERKMHFQVVNCPSQVYTIRITTHTHTERERDLSFFLSLFFRSSFVFVHVLLSSSRLCLCLCERIESKTELETVPLTLSYILSLKPIDDVCIMCY